MAAPLSLISKDDLERLNAFALSDAPASQENLSCCLKELSRANGSAHLAGVSDQYLVVAGLAIPKIRSYHEVEAIVGFPEELQHPVEQVSACFSLLRRHEFNAKNGIPQEPMRIPLEEVQRRLSHLLVQYPVLMDCRVLFGIRGPIGGKILGIRGPIEAECDWAPIACAIAETSFASLPRLSDDLTSKQLRLFAANASVKAGLYQHAPSSNSARSSVRGRTPIDIATGVDIRTPIDIATGVNADPSIGTRGAFLTSYLQLNEYAKQLTGRAYFNPKQRNTEGEQLYAALAKVFWDVATNVGLMSNVTRGEFVYVMKLQSPFALVGQDSGICEEFDKTVATASGAGSADTSMLKYHLALKLDEYLFGVPAFGSSGTKDYHFGLDEMKARTVAAAQLLVDIGAMAQRKDAMTWLSSVSVGSGRMDAFFVAPNCSYSCALGFLEALHEDRVQATLSGTVMRGDTRPPGTAASLSTQLAYQVRETMQLAYQVRETWESALHVFQTTKTMESVFQAHASEVTHTSSDTVLRSRAQRRQV